MPSPRLCSAHWRLGFKHGKDVIQGTQSSNSQALALAIQTNCFRSQASRVCTAPSSFVGCRCPRNQLSSYSSRSSYLCASYASSEDAFGFVLKAFLGSNLRLNQYCSSTTEEIRLVDENGHSVGIVKYDDAQRQAEEKGYELRLVGHAGQKSAVSTYRLMAPTSPKEEDKEKAQVKKEKVKEVIFKTGIGQQDLQWKTKHITEFLADDQRVRVIVKKRFRSSSRAEETMEMLMERIKDVAVLDGAVKSLPNGLAFKLRPKRR